MNTSVLCYKSISISLTIISLGEMASIDPAFIQPIQHRLTPTSLITHAQGIPNIDLISLSSMHHTTTSPLVTSIRDACTHWGFFQVTNHGVPLHTLHNLNRVALDFFSLPDQEKRKVSRDEANPLGYYDSEHTKNVRDWKQVFDFTARDPTIIPVSPDDPIPKHLLNRWPHFPPHLREAAQTYATQVEKLAFKLMQLIALSLGLEPNRFNAFFEDHTSFVRLNYYPPCPSPHLVLGVTRHKDAGGLTILAQDDVGGLQVRRKSDGEWVSIKPDPAAFIINIGDVIQVWSNDKYESVEHRVMVHSDKQRISIPFFFNPAHYVMVKPLEELVDDHNTAKYTEYNYGAFFASKRKSNLKKLNVDNLQISHFRITQ